MSRLASNIAQLFTGKTTQELEAQPPKPQKEKPARRAINTSRGGPNMPRFQPCPLGHGPKKRVAKTVGGALYHCNKCQSDFLISHP